MLATQLWDLAFGFVRVCELERGEHVETGTQWSEHCRGLREWAEGNSSPTVENGFNHCSLLRERVGLEPPASIGTSESGWLPIPQIFTFAFSQSWEQLYELSNPHFKVDEEQTDVTCGDNIIG